MTQLRWSQIVYLYYFAAADLLFLVNLPLSQRTLAPTAQLDTLSLTSPPQARLSVPLLSFPVRRFLNARSLFNLPASPSQLVRRQRVLPVEVREDLVVKVADADKLVVDEDVAVVVQAVVDVLLVE